MKVARVRNKYPQIITVKNQSMKRSKLRSIILLRYKVKATFEKPKTCNLLPKTYLS